MRSGYSIGEWNVIEAPVDGIHKVLLYQLYAFYVELLYNPNDNCIDALKSFSNTVPLEILFRLNRFEGVVAIEIRCLL
jgi:hypothetical protein